MSVVSVNLGGALRRIVVTGALFLLLAASVSGCAPARTMGDTVHLSVYSLKVSDRDCGIWGGNELEAGIQALNVADVAVTGIRAQLSFTNAFGENLGRHNLEYTGRLEPGEQTELKFKNPPMCFTSEALKTSKAKVHLQAVALVDGSILKK